MLLKVFHSDSGTHTHGHTHTRAHVLLNSHILNVYTYTHTRIAEIQLEFSVFFHQLLCSQLAPALLPLSPTLTLSLFPLLSLSPTFSLSLNCLPSLAICFHLPHISYSYSSNALGARTQREIVLCGRQMGVAVGHS